LQALDVACCAVLHVFSTYHVGYFLRLEDRVRSTALLDMFPRDEVKRLLPSASNAAEAFYPQIRKRVLGWTLIPNLGARQLEGVESYQPPSKATVSITLRSAMKLYNDQLYDCADRHRRAFERNIVCPYHVKDWNEIISKFSSELQSLRDGLDDQSYLENVAEFDLAWEYLNIGIEVAKSCEELVLYRRKFSSLFPEDRLSRDTPEHVVKQLYERLDQLEPTSAPTPCPCSTL